MISRHLFGEPTPREAYALVSKCTPDLSSIMSILTYTAKQLLSSSCGSLKSRYSRAPQHALPAEQLLRSPRSRYRAVRGDFTNKVQ
jgi:hypothetical protein